MAALDEPLFAVGSRHHIVSQLGQRAVAVTGDDQHRYIPPFGDSGHLFQPGALPGGREHDEDVFGGQRLSKGKVLLVDCAGNAPLAQVAEPDGGIEGHRQAPPSETTSMTSQLRSRESICRSWRVSMA